MYSTVFFSSPFRAFHFFWRTYIKLRSINVHCKVFSLLLQALSLNLRAGAAGSFNFTATSNEAVPKISISHLNNQYFLGINGIVFFSYNHYSNWWKWMLMNKSFCFSWIMKSSIFAMSMKMKNGCDIKLWFSVAGKVSHAH